MAKKWTNHKFPGALFFVTGNVLNRRDIFKNPSYCQALLEELQDLRRRGCNVIAFVLMPDHVHFILNPRGGDIQACLRVLKSLSAKRIVEQAPSGYFLDVHDNQLWQESFKSLPLWSGWMVDQKINYIHANPVKALLCNTAEEYRWSSFRSFYRDETDPLFAIDRDWWHEGDQESLMASVAEWEADRVSGLAREIEQRKDTRDDLDA